MLEIFAIKKRKFLTFMLLVLVFNTKAQNLFVNGDFELVETDCPAANPNLSSGSTAGFHRVTGWSVLNNHNGSADPFYSCNVSFLYPNHPVTNFRGSETACSGTNYIGLVTYRENLNNAREYVTAELSTPLQAGVTYDLSFCVSLSDDSKFSTQGIQWLFSNAIPTVPLDPTKPFPSHGYYGKHLERDNIDPCAGCEYTLPITTNVGWETITTQYTATGGETFFTIGNFKNDNNTTATLSGLSTNAMAAYYFDNFQLTEVISLNPTVVPTDPTGCVIENGFLTVSNLAADTVYEVGYTVDGNTVATSNYTTDANGEFIINGLGAGTYTDIIIYNNGVAVATVSGPFVLTTPNAPNFTLVGTDPTSCGLSDGFFTLNDLAVNTDYTLTYTTPNGIVGPQLITTDANGSYEVNGLPQGDYLDVTIDLLGCETVLPGVSLSGPNAVQFDVSGENPTGCGADDGEIMLFNLAPNTAYVLSYLLDGAIVGPLNITTSSNGDYIIANAEAGNYSDFEIEVNGCTSSNAGITLAEGSAPNATIDFVNPSNCETADGEMVLSNLSNDVSYSISYSFNANAPQTITATANNNGEIQLPNLSGGDYTNIIVALNGCEANLGDLTLVTPSDLPFSLGDDIPFCEEQIIIEAPSNYDDYMWNNGINTANLTVTEPGIYGVTVEVNGCSGYDEVSVFEDCPYSLYIPNSFTPDGNEYNNTFFAKGERIEKFKMLVFNRWGEVIFETNNIKYGWDGVTPTGETAKTGIYIYKIEFTYLEDGVENTDMKTGHFSLLR